MTASHLELQMAQQLRYVQAEPWEVEYVFAKPRKWRFDFAWPAKKLALEIEGGTFVHGAHSRGKHFESDVEKYNAATLLGWRVIRATTDMVKDGRALNVIEQALKGNL